MAQPVDLETSLEEQIRKDGILKAGDRVLVACSGGPDSVALAHAVCALAGPWKWKVALAHLDHGLRKDSGRDAAWVKSFAKRQGIPCYAAKGAVRQAAGSEKESIEEAARRLRYDFLFRTARRTRCGKVLLAHTKDDQAETVLMRILQGTGLRGLCGIRRVLRLGEVTFYRPWLGIPKSEIREYLKQRRVKFRTDSSNRSLRFLRNRVRLTLLPLLKTRFNPRIADALARLAENLDRDLAVLAEVEDAAWKRVFQKGRKGEEFLRRAAFAKMAPSIQFRLLDRALKRVHPKSGLDAAAWDRLGPHLERRRSSVSLPKGVQLCLTPTRLRLERSPSRPCPKD